MEIDLTMDEIIANSYKNFHTKGLDYLCLKRTPELTVKYYFFEGDVEKLPEVVNPHDHRYSFFTTCISGAVENFWYKESSFGETYNTFNYMTPLNGGTGFDFDSEKKLYVNKKNVYTPGLGYKMFWNEVHTINVRANQTIIKLEQYEDKVPLVVPTKTFCIYDEPPSLTGLYDQFTEDEIIKKIKILMELNG